MAMTYERIYRKDQWIVDDQGKVTGVRISGKNTELSGIVTSSRNPLTGGNRISRLQAGSQLVPVEMKYKRSTVAIVGDSFAVREAPEAGPNWYGRHTYNGLFYWTNIMLGARFECLYVSGESGSPPWTWLTNGSVDAALVYSPEYLWLTGAAGGSVTTNTAADYIAAYTSIFDKAASAGSRIIVHLMPPSTALSTAATRLRTQQVNAWLKHTAPLNWDVIPLSLAGATLAPGSLTYQAEATNLTDGTHWQCPGAFSAATIAARTLDPLIPKWSPPWVESYDSASGGNTAFIQSPLMIGTGGGLGTLTSTTGIPAGWTATITAGESGTANTSARTDGESGGWLDFAVTFTATGKYAEVYNGGADLCGKVAGDYVEFFAEMKIDPATAARIKAPYFYVEFANAGIKYATGGDKGSLPPKALGLASFVGKTASDIYILHADKTQIPAGTTAFNVTVGIASAGAGTCNFSIGRVAIK